MPHTNAKSLILLDLTIVVGASVTHGVTHEGKGAPAEGADLLYGMAAVAGFLNVSARQGYHLADKAGLPTFKLSGVVCARRSTLSAWLAEREAAARKPVLANA